MDPAPHGTFVGSAIRWATLSQVVRQGVQLLTIVVLARSLPPADFGLITMAVVVVGFVGLFKDLNLGSSVIQRSDAPVEWLSTLFWLTAGLGLLVTGALLVVAPVVAYIYREPALTDILRVLSVTFLISGLSVVHQALLERDLRYRSVAQVETVAAVTGSLVALLMAAGGGGVWSLVGQVLVSAAVGTALFWIASPWWPRRTFQIQAARGSGAFGLGLTTFNVTNYVSRNADYFLIGRSLGPEQLGFYTLAYRLMLIPLQMVTSVVNRVMFPRLSRLQDDHHRFARVYLSGVAATAFAAFPIGLGLAATAPRLIPVVLGSGWGQAIPVAIILSFVGVIQSVGASVGPVFVATGAMQALARWGAVSSVVVVAAFLLGLPWGIVGVAVAYLVATLVLLYPSFSIALRPIGLDPSRIMGVTFRPALAALLMAAAVVGLSRAIGDGIPDIAALTLEVGLGIVTYLGLSLMINQDQTRFVLGRLARA